MDKHPVALLLDRWPSRRDVHSDATAADESLDMVAVHRWFQRCSVPAKYWQALLAGSRRRGLGITSDDFVAAHCPPQPLDTQEAQARAAERGAA